MTTYTSPRIITAAALTVALGFPAQPTAATPDLVAPIFAIEQDEAAYEWMQDTFATAGFEQPAVNIEFFDNDEPCNGVRGQTRYVDEGPAHVTVCATHVNPEVQEQWRQRTLLHEMAHAWINENVSTKGMEAFTELRGLETWSSRDFAWELRATEHAAEILMWGIQDGDYNVDFRIDGTSCGELSAGFELLTGASVECPPQSS